MHKKLNFSKDIKKKLKDTLIVNLFSGPGGGKTTMMSGIFTELNYRYINCEMSPEYAKEKVWSNSLNVLEDQLYVFAHQQHRLWRLNGKVDVIITDSPLLLSIIYGDRMKPSFKELVKEQYSLYNNINFFLERCNPYVKSGRIQKEEDAKLIDKKIINMLDELSEPYVSVLGDKSSLPIIVNKILSYLNKNNHE